jgi:hypothetical protein
MYKRKVLFIGILLGVYTTMIFSLLSDNLAYLHLFITNGDFRNSLSQEFSGPIAFFIHGLTQTVWAFDYSVIFGTYFFQFLIPFISVIATTSYWRRFRSVGVMSYSRSASFKRCLWQDSFSATSWISFACFLGFFLFWLTCIFISKGAINQEVTRPLFSDWFGESFYGNHRYLYMLLEGVVRFFFVPLIYGIFGIGLLLLDSDNKVYLIGPLLYYYGWSIVGMTIMSYHPIGLYLTPTVLMASGDYYAIQTVTILFTNAIPLMMGLGLIWRKGEVIEL